MRTRLVGAAAAVLLAGCGGQAARPPLVVGATTDTESVVLAHVYAAALRNYGSAAVVSTAPDPLARLDAGEVSVVPGLTGRFLRTFAPGNPAVDDVQVYRAMVNALPEGVAAGDYAESAADAPVLVVTAATAQAWRSRELEAAVSNCATLTPGVVAGGRAPTSFGTCRPQPAREFPSAAAMFDALRAGRINAAWSTSAAPDTPEDLVTLTDTDPELVAADNVVPLYRRNELSESQLLALNQIAGVLDTAALADMRRAADRGADPAALADAFLAEHPLGR